MSDLLTPGNGSRRQGMDGRSQLSPSKRLENRGESRDGEEAGCRNPFSGGKAYRMSAHTSARKFDKVSREHRLVSDKACHSPLWPPLLQDTRGKITIGITKGSVSHRRSIGPRDSNRETLGWGNRFPVVGSGAPPGFYAHRIVSPFDHSTAINCSI